MYHICLPLYEMFTFSLRSLPTSHPFQYSTKRIKNNNFERLRIFKLRRENSIPNQHLINFRNQFNSSKVNISNTISKISKKKSISHSWCFSILSKKQLTTETRTFVYWFVKLNSFWFFSRNSNFVFRNFTIFGYF